MELPTCFGRVDDDFILENAEFFSIETFFSRPLALSGSIFRI
jgi:hypothetical protein